LVQPVEKRESAFRGLWPSVHDLAAAKAASRQAVWASGFIVVVTSVVAMLGVLGMGASSLVDVGLFLAIGIGIYRMSRTASLAGLLLFIVERVVMFLDTGRTGGLVAIVLLLAFANGVRGTFAYQRHKREEGKAASAPGAAEQGDEPDNPQSTQR